MFKAMLIAGCGGFIGTCLRFLTGRLCQTAMPGIFPWGTFIANIAGSFFIGIFFGLAEKTHIVSPHMGIFLITGFCGGFTTFSSLSYDMLLLIQNRQWTTFTLYTLLSFVIGIAAVLAGRYIVKSVTV